MERAEKERLRQELQPSDEDEIELTEEEMQKSLVDFWTTMQGNRPPKKRTKE
jgi:hypothetical protein